VLSFAVLGICIFILGYKLVKDCLIDGIPFSEIILPSFMASIGLAVAAIPEGLATVVTIVLSIGVTNMSKKNAVIRKLTAVETLGCADIICSDKTGTLTQNKMTVVENRTGDKMLLATILAMCSDATLNGSKEAVGEPTECALVNWAYAEGLDKTEQDKATPRVGEAPFDSLRKMMSTLVDKNGKVVQYTKGAPDEVLKVCTRALIDGKVVALTEDIRAGILAENKAMADEALRVLAGAYKEYDKLPSDTAAEKIENDLIYVGLVGMIDPVRPEVKDAIELCRQAGIRPIMITGDHIDTAVAIAKQLNIITDSSEAITGAEIAKMSDEEFHDAIKRYSVYARVQPEHKVRIVTTWKALGKITAMTGDGVNDAPSIKSADIGVGMGITGTDVTKNTADMVLSDDNFATIVTAVAEGRRIYDNIKKAIQFLLSSNLSEVVAIFVATVLGITLLKPVHLLWINLITDTFPALALGMEQPETDIMSRPPRPANEGIFAHGLALNVVLHGVLVAALTVFAYFLGHYMESGTWALAESQDGMTMAFMTLSMAEIFHAYNVRSNKSIFRTKQQNKWLWAAMAFSLLLTTLVIYVPFLARAFSFAPITAADYFISLALAFSIVPLVEIQKLIMKVVERRK
jgi:Ca2+-transporting ATPase